MSQIARSPASFTEVKNALLGRCQEVAINVCKIDPVDVSQIVAKRRFIHHCGAKKGRMSNPDAMIGGCDGCKAKWSGPIDFVMQELRVDKYEAKDLLAAYFGIEGTSRGGVSSRPRAKTQAINQNAKVEPIELSEDGYSKHKQILTVSESNESMMLVCAKHKRGVTVDALLQIGAVCAYWQQSEKSKKQHVIAIPVYAGPKLDLVNYILYGLTGKIWVREKSDGGDWIDTHVSKRLAFGQNDEDRKRGVKFDRNGICCSLAVREAILRGQKIDRARLAKFEGDSDLLVALPLLTLEDSWIAWTNNDGARSTHVFDWLIGLLSPLGIKESIVIHDRDKAGELGAVECAKHLSQMSPTKIIKLPFDYQEKKGPDFRDYINAGNDKTELLELIANTEVGISDVKPIPVNEMIATSSGEAVTSDCEIESPADPHRLARINIESYRDQSGGELRYYKNSWYKWRVGKWQNIADSDLRAKISVSIRKQFEADQKHEYAIWEESLKEGEPPPKIRHVTRNLVNNVIAAMEGMCIVPSSIEMPTWLDDRQSKPYIAFENGLLDYDKLFANHEDAMKPPSHLWFSLSTIPYFLDVNARCDRWQEFLADVLESDQQRLDLLQEWFGYLLLPDTRFQKALISEGSGSNGKTVVNAGATAMLGESNISNLCIDDFANKFALGSTYGKMLNISADLGTVDQVAEGTLKQFIGGDRIFIDRKNREPMSIRPTCKLMASWNDRPKIRDRSNGIWRRLIIMPFRVTVDESRAIKGMDSPAYWRDEAPGICNWALVGLYRLLNQGRFTISKVCNEASESYRTESSPVAMFLSEYIKAMPGSYVKSKVLYEKYLQWSQENGYERVSNVQILGKEVSSKFKAARRRVSVEDRPWVYDGIGFIE
jgi:P4 family phage/plasmid primase-like protien